MPDTITIKNARISVRGVVQGVGFRPFVYQLAAQHDLKGWVCNTSGDVTIEVEGMGQAITSFFDQLTTEAPPLAQIDHINVDYGEPAGYRRFEIKGSRSEKGRYQRVSPDSATCPLCLTELFNEKDRRFRHPFINCTHCGPRFTIIRDIPYDRPQTTMQNFIMCPDCQREYDDPADRRFHAQPTCCPRCGPQLKLTDKEGTIRSSQDPLADAAALLKAGMILAVKGIGGFLLACDATNEDAVQRLRRRKQRPCKPFAVMMTSLQEAEEYCTISPEETGLLTSPLSPIVLVPLKDHHRLAPGIAPKLTCLGVMLPYTPLHHLLLYEAQLPLVMTSGNLSEEPIVKDNDEALLKLAPIADYFLVHDRDIHVRCDDSVTMIENGKPQVIRRARGYAPDPVLLPFKAREVLACGAQLKSTFCITKDQYAFISQHLGDLENLETLSHFEHMLDLYQKLFRLQPHIIAHDKHPDYLTTRFARELKNRDATIELIPVQHHHAHIVSCLTENKVTSPALGVAFDGSGYGEDGCIWGGEFFLVDHASCHRLAHLEYVPLPGGEAAIKKPYRMAISYLLTLLGTDALGKSLSFLKHIGPGEKSIIERQIEKGINTPLTSSAGRLFDGVSALMDIVKEVDYEGQAAVWLEMIAGESSEPTKLYPFEIEEKNGVKIVRLKKIFAAIVDDLIAGVPQPLIAATFHQTLAQMTACVCQACSRATGIRQVALSGGVFQNRLFATLARRYLADAGLTVITHSAIPCNDGGISLGQAVVANYLVM